MWFYPFLALFPMHLEAVTHFCCLKLCCCRGFTMAISNIGSTSQRQFFGHIFTHTLSNVLTKQSTKWMKYFMRMPLNSGITSRYRIHYFRSVRQKFFCVHTYGRQPFILRMWVRVCLCIFLNELNELYRIEESIFKNEINRKMTKCKY